MRIQFLFLISAWLLLAHAGQVFAQQLVVRLNNGSEITRELNQVRKLTFDPGEVSVVLNTGIAESYDMQSVQKLYFVSLTTGIGNTLNPLAQVYLYPNPANDIVYLNGLPEGNSDAYLYSFEGRLILSCSLTPEANSINLSSLKSGIYILILDNQAIKLIRL